MLDEPFYPHIVDLIFDYAPRESLLVMRAVSRDWCRRTDCILARHLILTTSSSTKAPWAVMGPQGRLPWAESLLGGIDRDGSDSDSSAPYARCNESTIRLYDSLEHVRVLEMDTVPGEHPPVAQYTNLEVVKLLCFPFSSWGGGMGMSVHPWAQSPTVIAFSSLSIGPDGHVRATIRQDFIPQKRFVLNIIDSDYFDQWPMGGVDPLRDTPATLKQVVFVLHRETGRASIPSAEPPRYPLRSLCIVADAFMAYISETITITIVRPESMETYEYATPLPNDVLSSTTMATLKDLVRQASETRHLGWNDDDVDRLARTVQVLTYDEYKHRVGPWQYQFETT